MELFLNKYKPYYLENFELDPDVFKALNTLDNMNQLNILFVGSIGSGKTSLLQSIIRKYYENTDKKEYQNNILHINSLKEQGINYYRNDVKIFCQTCSSIKNKKKFVMLDDMDDFINEQSQEVFRNYIDKYSHNVFFISSCTNIQKIIENLQSRFIIIKLKPLERHSLQKIMDKIIVQENINITEDARDFILSISNHSVKTLINYLEKFKLLGEPIDYTIANVLCTNISITCFEKYTRLLKLGQLKEAISILYIIYEQGYSVMDILDNYFLFVKITDLLSENEKYSIIEILCKYTSIFYNIHEESIELPLFSNNVYSVLYGKT
jgi:DNA polymerase III delta prime subunit